MTHRAHHTTVDRFRHRGVTIIEVALSVAIVIVVLAVTIPSLATVGCTSFRAQSKANLAALSQAHIAYAADWSDRQFTMTPDNVGAFGGCANYVAAGKCIPNVSYGLDCNGNEVGVPIGCGPSANCTNFDTAKPMNFAGPNAGFGAYRIPNAAGFQPYVDGRFYSPTFYAPDDYAIIADVEPLLSSPCGYAGDPGAPIYSSYCNSPAAMWGLGVLKKQTGYKNPNTLVNGYASSPVTACVYPNLKTRMMELRALDAPCYSELGPCDEFWFHQMYEARSLGLMFDGSVRIVSPREAMESDTRVKFSSQPPMVEKGLWVRNTPLGANGVFGNLNYDLLADTNFHLLTGDGIAGRDVIDW
jgi:type II secretory pathway pseudopilin PulG